MGTVQAVKHPAVVPLKSQVIHIELLAPDKPPEGAVCNGCGLCCLAEPCPLGILLFRQRAGACPALRWEESARQYRCGAVSDPLNVAAAALPVRLQFVAPILAGVLRRSASRWVAAGTGCDSNLEAAASPRMAKTTDRENHDD